MVAKFIVVMIASFLISFGALTFLPKASDSKIAEAVNSEVTLHDKVHRSTSVDNASTTPAVDNQPLKLSGSREEVLERLKHVSAEITVKIEENRTPHMRSTLEQAKDVIDKVTQALEQREISTAEAQHISAIAFSQVAKQAESFIDEFERSKRRLNSPEFQEKVAAGFADLLRKKANK
jgi:hypothetical protein